MSDASRSRLSLHLNGQSKAVRVDPELKSLLEEHAARTKTSLSDYCRTLLDGARGRKKTIQEAAEAAGLDETAWIRVVLAASVRHTTLLEQLLRGSAAATELAQMTGVKAP